MKKSKTKWFLDSWTKFSRFSSRVSSSFLKDELGQSTTEYILILSVVVMIAMKFKQVFGSKLDGILTTLGGKIDQATADSGTN